MVASNPLGTCANHVRHIRPSCRRRRKQCSTHVRPFAARMATFTRDAACPHFSISSAPAFVGSKDTARRRPEESSALSPLCSAIAVFDIHRCRQLLGLPSTGRKLVRPESRHPPGHLSGREASTREAATNAKSCEPEGPQDLTQQLSHSREPCVKRSRSMRRRGR